MRHGPEPYSASQQFRNMCGAAAWMARNWVAYHSFEALYAATLALDARGGKLAALREQRRKRVDDEIAEVFKEVRQKSVG